MQTEKNELSEFLLYVKRSLLLHDSGIKDAELQTGWKMKHDFDYHWATHCIDAIKAIHDYLTQ
jgi:hypothetical protein